MINDNMALSERFEQEYENRKRILYTKMGYTAEEKRKFITIPLYDVLHSVSIGSKSSLSKDQISSMSKFKIKKAQIRKQIL